MELVFIENNRPVTDSLTVAETFGKNHKDVLRDIRNLECSQEFNQRNFAPIDYTDTQNRTYQKYLITQDGFSFLVMGYTGKEAARFKEMYIGEFNRMREQLNNPKLGLPQNYKEALIALVGQVEKNEVLETEKLMLQQQVRELEPKASYLDRILQSKDTVSITQIAKDYGLTGQQLNQILHDEKVQYKQSGQWLLYQKYQDKGFTKSQTIDVLHNSGQRSVKMNTKWSQKGRLFIHELLGKQGIIPSMDKDHSRAN